MRTPHLAGAVIIGATAMIGSGHAEEVPQAQASTDEGPLDRPFAKQKGRMGLSQRQVRKNRRRAHAAGKRNAFAR